MTTLQLLELHPDQLTADANVRMDLRLDDAFVKSIKVNGIIQPVVAYPDPETPGIYRILAGHRRVAAAVKLGLDVVPVVVGPTPEDADRIVEQLVENTHRAALTTAEQVSAYKQLALDFGLPAMAIAKKTASPLAHIGDAIRIAKSPVASKIVNEHQVTLDEALIFDEFADDENAIASLNDTLAAEPGQLAHRAQQLRNERDLAAAKARCEDQITAAGITLLDKEPSYGDKTWKSATSLTADGKRLDEETALAEAGEDLAAYPVIVGRRDDNDRYYQTYVIHYVVKNWRDHGWKHYEDDMRNKGPLSDEDKAQRRLARENGKLWVAATQVRKDWVKQLLQRRSLPSDWAAVTAMFVADNGELLGYGVKNTAADLLGIDHPAYQHNTFGDLLRGNIHQAPHVLLAAGAAAHERSVDEKQGWNTDRPAFALYLQMLSSWGYTLSELEEQLVQRLTTTDAA